MWLIYGMLRLSWLQLGNSEYAVRCADSTNRCNCTHRSHYYDVNHIVLVITTITTTTTLAIREGGRGRTSPEGGYRLGTVARELSSAVYTYSRHHVNISEGL